MSGELRIGNETNGLLLKETPLQDTTGLLKALVFDAATGEIKYYGVLPNISNPDGTYDIQNLDKTFIVQTNGNDYYIGQVDFQNNTWKGLNFIGYLYNYVGDQVEIISETAIISPPNEVFAHIIKAVGGAELRIRTDGVFAIHGGLKNNIRQVGVAGGITINLSDRYIILSGSAGPVRLPSVPASEENQYFGITYNIINRTGSQQLLIPDTIAGKIEGSTNIYPIPNNTNIEVILISQTYGWIISSKSTI